MKTGTESGSMRNGRSKGPLLTLLLLCVLSSGCVYLRLLKFRQQLVDFDDNFTLAHSPGAYIEMANPVLKPGDLRWLTGIEGVVSRSPNGMEMREYRFLKISAPDGDLPKHQEVWMNSGFVKGRLQSVEFPETFNEIFNHEMLRRAFHGADKGAVDESDKATGWALHKDLVIPDRAKIYRLLGLPSAITTGLVHDELVYKFHRPPMSESVPAEPDIWFRFFYDRKGGKMSSATVQVGWLQIIVRKWEDGQYGVRIRRGKYESP